MANCTRTARTTEECSLRLAIPHAGGAEWREAAQGRGDQRKHQGNQRATWQSRVSTGNRHPIARWWRVVEVWRATVDRVRIPTGRNPLSHVVPRARPMPAGVMSAGCCRSQMTFGSIACRNRSFRQTPSSGEQTCGSRRTTSRRAKGASALQHSSGPSRVCLVRAGCSTKKSQANELIDQKRARRTPSGNRRVRTESSCIGWRTWGAVWLEAAVRCRLTTVRRPQKRHSNTRTGGAMEEEGTQGPIDEYSLCIGRHSTPQNPSHRKLAAPKLERADQRLFELPRCRG